MTLDDYNTFCASLPHSEHVIQWGGADVWKVAGKLFAIARGGGDGSQVTFKTSEIAYEVLRQEPGLRPAPYMASRGMKWIQHYAEPGLDDENLRIHIEASYHMAIKRLTKKKRLELEL
ncbi:MAG: MmcQ/YjbR family DNA-binding protein [Hellea sp.]